MSWEYNIFNSRHGVDGLHGEKIWGERLEYKKSILIVDDDENALAMLESAVKKWGFHCLSATSAHEGQSILRKTAVDLIISDYKMSNMDGIQLLQSVRTEFGDIPFILLTAHGSINTAIASIKKGADDFVEKPFNPDSLLATINRSLEFRKMVLERKVFKGELDGKPGTAKLISTSSLMGKALELAAKVAASPNTTVAIFGESGTGKEVMARVIHSMSKKMAGPFVAVNCAGIPATLIESELFGYEKGAFTGAENPREGKFELAQGGTLLLDEIGDMPLEIQPKLLRVLQERKYERLGSNREYRAEQRIIVTTHKDIDALVNEGRFRGDLYHRINVFPIYLPPLRDRKEDVPVLAAEFLGQFSKEMGKTVSGFSADAMEKLKNHNWPGNIRELKNCIERAVILADGKVVESRHITCGKTVSEGASGVEDGFVKFDIKLRAGEVSMRNIEKEAMRVALEMNGNNKSLAAKYLKVARKRFYS